MKSLLKWQILSLISRLVAMAIGLFQTFFIIRILTPSDWGIIQIGLAVGGAFGIYQHLGLSSGSTREISTAKDDTDIFKIFVTSVVIRYIVTIPIALFLFFSAEKIALGQYSQEILVNPIKIYSLVLLIQGIKGLMNSVVAGTKRFKYLFLYQSGIAVVSAIIYIPMVYYKGIVGFFQAFFLFELISTIVLGVIAFAPLKSKMQLPNKSDFVRLGKQLFSILFAVYIVKILITQWEKSGTLLLGRDIAPEAVAIFSFAFLFSKKLMHVSDAVTDVNLPVLSDKFENNIQEFRDLFSQNLNKIFVFMVFSGMSAVFWSRELVYIFVGDNNTYSMSLPLMLPFIFTFIFYGLTNIIKSSVFIPGKFIKELLFGYILIFAVTIAGYFIATRTFSYDPIYSMTYTTLLGSSIGFIYLVISSQHKLNFRYFDYTHVLVLFQVFVMMLVRNIAFIYKIPVFIAFVALYMLAVYSAKLFTKEDFMAVLNKVNSLKNRKKVA